MNVSEFDYYLPPELIAQTPIEPRHASRLMVVDRASGKITNGIFTDLASMLDPGDILIANDSRVIPARLIGRKETSGGKVELLLLERLGPRRWQTLAGGKRIADGLRINILDREGNASPLIATIKASHEGAIRDVKFNESLRNYINELGQVPLPPYIHESLDEPERYQTVYAKKTGAVAAPTAGLHFTDEIIEKLKAKGVKIAPVVLHVGLGTFRPVQVEDLSRHQMDSEYFEISEESAEIINEAKKNNNKVVAVGTTSVRALETVATPDGMVKHNSGWTDKFIFPPYSFKTVDALITNFHLPQSTLFILVSTFAGIDYVKNAYEQAIEGNYRFYSYAMQ